MRVGEGACSGGLYRNMFQGTPECIFAERCAEADVSYMVHMCKRRRGDIDMEEEKKKVRNYKA